MTAPERICAPTSEPFSTTTTDASGAICLILIAAARPAGPAPTITTSNSIASRAGRSVALIACSRIGLLQKLACSTIGGKEDIPCLVASHGRKGSSINLRPLVAKCGQDNCDHDNC